jgi:hypothetical protein
MMIRQLAAVWVLAKWSEQGLLSAGESLLELVKEF